MDVEEGVQHLARERVWVGWEREGERETIQIQDVLLKKLKPLEIE
jgi:hypothetical protein